MPQKIFAKIYLINLIEKQQKTKQNKMEDLWDKSKTPPQSATQLKTIIYGFKKKEKIGW